jgi:hypothetical protein
MMAASRTSGSSEPIGLELERDVDCQQYHDLEHGKEVILLFALYPICGST